MIAFLFAVLLIILHSTSSGASNGLRGNTLVRSKAFVYYFSLCSKFLIMANLLLSWQSGPQPRIIGGEAVDDPRYPYFAMMWGSSLCGGALIAPDLVVSAAHVSFRLLNFVCRSIDTHMCKLTGAIFFVSTLQCR